MCSAGRNFQMVLASLVLSMTSLSKAVAIGLWSLRTRLLASRGSWALDLPGPRGPLEQFCYFRKVLRPDPSLCGILEKLPSVWSSLEFDNDPLLEHGMPYLRRPFYLGKSPFTWECYFTWACHPLHEKAFYLSMSSFTWEWHFLTWACASLHMSHLVIDFVSSRLPFGPKCSSSVGVSLWPHGSLSCYKKKKEKRRPATKAEPSQARGATRERSLCTSDDFFCQGHYVRCFVP